MFTTAALLAFVAKYWHQAFFVAVLVLWAVVLRFRAITLVEALLVTLTVLGYAQGAVSALVAKAIGGVK